MYCHILALKNVSWDKQITEHRGEPDFIMGFLPSSSDTTQIIKRLRTTWPNSLTFGCESSFQVSDAQFIQGGCLVFGWLEFPTSKIEVTILENSSLLGKKQPLLSLLRKQVTSSDAIFVLADGLNFPVSKFLSIFRRACPQPTLPIFGGLASKPEPPEPIETPRARVFYQGRVYEGGCLLCCWKGFDVRCEILHGWDPASPIYTVTRAKGQVMLEIDGRPATEWYGRFFRLENCMERIPEIVYRFPLIIEGTQPERRGIYRSMKLFNEPHGSVTFWGDICKGDQVRLGIDNNLSLITLSSFDPESIRPDLGLFLCCVGRELVLGDQASKNFKSSMQSSGMFPWPVFLPLAKSASTVIRG